MGFLSGLIGTAVRVAVTPLAIVDDVANVVQGEDPTTTINHIGDTASSLCDALEDGADGDIL